ncbi:LabA-like NYN domain-containing protein [Halomarina oriensis]|uniref:NYN domain-containing protein n=1 Tax=Halomarina oriensis TaxID=671145 RepID=A0A6B0GKC6_9EURY|nr:NYN domain-containing protein [Halomarina oriensis]MWG35204.1 NYN domain-containing protein [Halomarina oriensis]
MPPLHPDQRVAVLADARNLYHTTHSLYSRNVDYTELLDTAVQDRRLVRAIAYVVRAHAPEEESFFDALDDIGFETRIKDLKTFSDGTKKADWDVGISLDAVTLAEKVDTIVICSGDGDFTRLCSHIRHEGTRVEVMSFGPSTAETLVDAADSFVDLSEQKERFLL